MSIGSGPAVNKMESGNRPLDRGILFYAAIHLRQLKGNWGICVCPEID